MLTVDVNVANEIYSNVNFKSTQLLSLSELRWASFYIVRGKVMFSVVSVILPMGAVVPIPRCTGKLFHDATGRDPSHPVLILQEALARKDWRKEGPP